ncbi:MAG: hypothetical protein QM541_03815 [Flavobacterium sp.]|nr:hypothetical protein [Flavobacterium sp.]
MISLKKVLLVAIVLVSSLQTFAQNAEGAGAYMSSITNAQGEMNKKYMAYVSAAAHGKRLRKVEKLRQAAIESIQQSKYNTIGLPLFKGDNSLRQKSIDYINFCYKIFNDDYAHIVNMEEIAEQSFDEMQAYLLLQEKTGEKLQEANDNINKAYKEFAAKYNVQLVEGEKSELSQKMEVASKLTHYYNQVYLVFFKCNWQDGKLTEALNAKKMNDAEQSRNALIKYATEGLAALDTMKSFMGDPSLAVACKQALQFYKKNAEIELPKQLDFYLKQENFDKMKKAFEAKAPADRKKEDVDAYNKGVKDINAAVNAFNQSINTTNNNRTQVLQNWENTQKSFFDTHMPYYK